MVADVPPGKYMDWNSGLRRAVEMTLKYGRGQGRYRLSRVEWIHSGGPGELEVYLEPAESSATASGTSQE